MSGSLGELPSLAAAVLQPGFEGTEVPDWVRRWLGEGLGAVVLFARNVVDPQQVGALTAGLRAERPDVLVAIDEEAGDVTRFESRQGSSRPGNLALGAVDDPELTEAVARDLGLELAAAGINLNYAPDADVNSNPDNPVIGVRSFGATPDLVARHTAAWVRGLQSAGVAACAKHFPGHGDTSVDSHLDVPRIRSSRAQLDAGELPPFRAAIDAGVQAVMTGHLLVPAIDDRWPATLSQRVLVGLLRDELGFQGAVITDGIEMRAITDRYGIERATVRALAAGVDAICVGGDHADEGSAIRLRQAIVDAVVAGELPEERLVEAAKRVGQLAAWAAAARADRTPPAAAGSPPDRAAVNGAGGSPIGMAAARRALRLTLAPRPERAARLPLAGPAHVVEFAPPRNIAIGAETPWGLGGPLAELLPGTTTIRLAADGTDEALAAAALLPAVGRPLVLVVRDLHRHRWMADAVGRLLAARPDAVVVELGLPERVVGEVHLATHGATRAAGQAAARLLAGRS
ncbi:glycoside hydrolase family 3 protein [Solwaraspora sp. WMMD1047]|uniref:glycoside hydrolase family 3 protein n=1 Tax=Solwaraspora sp. WMMD1047 TaxID=3016102 RepID=UPI002417510F|nr:glycoside hydrolase family 3 protein [Solwaraspora sp. WMMD1047]MDG4830232.1 glycoside hydrolase family 3 protein [Solwaraspora sp. WMMD1047]